MTKSMFAQSFLEKPIENLSRKNKIYLIYDGEDDVVAYHHPSITHTFSIKINRNISPFQDLKSLISLIHLLRKENFDLVHTYTPKAGLLGMIASYITGVEHRLHTFTGQVWATRKGLFRIMMKRIDRLVVFLSTQILVDGESQKEYLIKQGVVNENDAVVLHNVSTSGIDLNKFKPQQTIREKIRNQYQLKNEDQVFLYLGRINEEKGINELISAYLNLKNERENVLLFLVGPIEMKISESNQKSYQDKGIVFIPYTKKPEEILQLCDVFCFPSHREGFGYSIIEASATEKPIICSDIYGLKYTCIENKTGLKHKVKSSVDLYEKMKFALDHPTEINQMGKNGRTYVKANFSDQEVLKKWEAFYTKFL